MLKTSLLIDFRSWSWYINMLPNQLSKLALMEFNILKAQPSIQINKQFTITFRDRVVLFLCVDSIIASKVSFSCSVWWDTFHYNMGRNTKIIWNYCGTNQTSNIATKITEEIWGKGEQWKQIWHLLLLMMKNFSTLEVLNQSQALRIGLH